MKPLTEIKQGCGKKFVTLENISFPCNQFVLCPSCQALLKQTEEIIKEIDEWLSIYCRNNECEFCRVNWIKLKELRQKIIGEKGERRMNQELEHNELIKVIGEKEDIKNYIENTKFEVVKKRFSREEDGKKKYYINYFLRFDDELVPLGLKYDISNSFRALLELVYDYPFVLNELPNSFFKKWVEKEYKKSVRRTKLTKIKKKSYYEHQRIESRKNRIKKLREEIKQLESLNDKGGKK